MTESKEMSIGEKVIKLGKLMEDYTKGGDSQAILQQLLELNGGVMTPELKNFIKELEDYTKRGGC